MIEQSNLDHLREEMRNITNNIIRLVQDRMEVAKKIGNIKHQLNIEIEDERVEHDIKNSVMKLTKDLGMDVEFSGKLLNLLLSESVKLQNIQNNVSKTPSHIAIFMKAKELERNGKKIIHLEVGEPDYPPPLKVKEILSKIFDNKKYHYTEIPGILQLRQKISKKFTNVGPEQVIVTPGGRFGIFCAITSLLTQGDEIINIEPSWPAYKECAEFIGAKVRLLKTTIEDSWTPNLEKLESLININTKMLVLNYPNNPTGKVLEGKSLEKIIAIAKDHDLYILSDEVYSDYSFIKYSSILDYHYDKSIMVSSFSKTYGMTGFRVGYGIANNDIMKKMRQVQATSITSVAEPMQYCALAALETHDVQSNIDLIKKRIDIICKRLDQMNAEYVVPDGAMYVYPKIISKNYSSDIDLVYALLDSGLAIAPGSGFGQTYKQFIRISACQPTTVLNEGLDILENFIV
ncbi:MAG TPA: aminotransferase class I/II-fold pyridoxal phosphate-dependent enzyme [Nitrososphaeraceae archaeon]|nr:aminotransferase class I/II-fold pyridoxal phosphate-dependent enzyme [Nitrososphaeraceae archaeon]